MFNRTAIISRVATAGLLIGIASGEGLAQELHQKPQHSMSEQIGEFQRIDQPLWVKVAVTVSGLGLIGLELWWFVLSKPKSRKATAQAGIQEITVTVDGGYEPNQIVVQAGQPVRLNFNRKDPSSCLEEVRFPDFQIAKALPLNQVTPIEFTPNTPGKYEFTCGMNMFRGVVDVQAAETKTTTALASPLTRLGSPET